MPDGARLADGTGSMNDAQGTAAAPQLILAFDYGTRRIGVASGDTLTRTARAVTTLDSSSGVPWPALEKLVKEFGPAQFIVGVPYNMDGTPTFLTATTRNFAREMQARFGRPAALVDERLSSREASGQLREARAAGLKRRRLTHADVDMTAAKVLLERWFQDPTAIEPHS